MAKFTLTIETDSEQDIFELGKLLYGRELLQSGQQPPADNAHVAPGTQLFDAPNLQPVSGAPAPAVPEKKTRKKKGEEMETSSPAAGAAPAPAAPVITQPAPAAPYVDPLLGGPAAPAAAAPAPATPAPAAPVATAPAVVGEPTYDDLKDQLVELMARTSAAGAQAALQTKFGVTALGPLPKEKYAEAFAFLQQQVAAAPAKK